MCLHICIYIVKLPVAVIRMRRSMPASTIRGARLARLCGRRRARRAKPEALSSTMHFCSLSLSLSISLSLYTCVYIYMYIYNISLSLYLLYNISLYLSLYYIISLRVQTSPPRHGGQRIRRKRHVLIATEV